MTIRNWPRIAVTAIVVLVFAGIGLADTLELKDGRVLQGRYLGGTQAVLRFEVNGDVQTFPTSDIVALTFTHGGSGAPPPAPPSGGTVPPPATSNTQPPGNNGGDVTLPAREPLLVRMIDGVGTATNHVGDNFHARLRSDLH